MPVSWPNKPRVLADREFEHLVRQRIVQHAVGRVRLRRGLLARAGCKYNTAPAAQRRAPDPRSRRIGISLRPTRDRVELDVPLNRPSSSTAATVHVRCRCRQRPSNSPVPAVTTPTSLRGIIGTLDLAVPRLAGAVAARAQRRLERAARLAGSAQDERAAARDQHRPSRGRIGAAGVPMTRGDADDATGGVANLEVLDEQRLGDELRRQHHRARRPRLPRRPPASPSVAAIRSAGKRIRNCSERPPLATTDVCDGSRACFSHGTKCAPARVPPKPPDDRQQETPSSCPSRSDQGRQYQGGSRAATVNGITKNDPRRRACAASELREMVARDRPRTAANPWPRGPPPPRATGVPPP